MHYIPTFVRWESEFSCVFLGTITRKFSLCVPLLVPICGRHFDRRSWLPVPKPVSDNASLAVRPTNRML